ncbi:MAG: T9SS type A sorting domain-containing protein [Flavobacteriales bacterium]|nr:T9SS type A sorting domain-containing protein [Flavobacteriales bacterium]
MFGPGTINNEETVFLAYYDGQQVRPAEYQPNSNIVALESYDGALYAAGSFSQFGSVETFGVARIDHSGVIALNPDTIKNEAGDPVGFSTANIRDLAILNDTLYLGGSFSQIGESCCLGGIGQLNLALSSLKREIPQLDFTVFPNPSTNSITVEATYVLDESTSILVYTPQGQLVATDTWPAGRRRKTLNIEQLADGMYLLQVHTSAGWISMRVVKG